jgi:hypothetical protein
MSIDSGRFVTGWIFGAILIILDGLLLILISIHVYLKIMGMTTFELLTGKRNVNRTLATTIQVHP